MESEEYLNARYCDIITSFVPRSILRYVDIQEWQWGNSSEQAECKRGGLNVDIANSLDVLFFLFLKYVLLKPANELTSLGDLPCLAVISLSILES